jgi:hypothetical protein
LTALPHVKQAIYRYLDCGDLNNGFARVKYRLQVVILDPIPDQRSLLRYQVLQKSFTNTCYYLDI